MWCILLQPSQIRETKPNDKVVNFQRKSSYLCTSIKAKVATDIDNIVSVLVRSIKVSENYISNRNNSRTSLCLSQTDKCITSNRQLIRVKAQQGAEGFSLVWNYLSAIELLLCYLKCKSRQVFPRARSEYSFVCFYQVWKEFFVSVKLSSVLLSLRRKKSYKMYKEKPVWASITLSPFIDF